ncbi:hypothetical protein NQ315_014767 [Exocentrus adspersus]|uniref:Maturase K n=1 Tax=Exocentrus adspersus TaxID=1586481 RepID=A0AAV8VN65_9CUCU|nr:hypothetical protein NQ315_014767 [Exocentrus adspersus]
MEIEEEMFIEDDFEVLDIIDYGFPRRVYNRHNHFDNMDDLSFFRRFRLYKETVLHVLQQIEHNLEFNNDFRYLPIFRNNSVSPYKSAFDDSSVLCYMWPPDSHRRFYGNSSISSFKNNK